jgi:hypothetical protein
MALAEINLSMTYGRCTKVPLDFLGLNSLFNLDCYS